METVTPRYVVDEHQTPTDVVLTIDEWRRVLAELEELDDIRAYDEAKSSAQESLPLEEVAPAQVRPYVGAVTQSQGLMEQ